MADYVPPSRRRNRLLLVGAACLVIGLVVGVLAGRASITTTSEKVAEVRSQGDELATRVQALTIEYDQAVAGSGDTVQGGVLDALDGIDTDAAAALATAEWLSDSSRDAVLQAIGGVRAAADDRASTEAFADQTASAAAVIRDELGVPTAP